MSWWPTKKQIETEREDDSHIHVVLKANGEIRTINNDSDKKITMNDGKIIIHQ